MTTEQLPGRLALIAMRLLQLLLLVALSLVIAVGGSLLAYQTQYAERIYEGISILGVEVGGLTRPGALARVHSAVEDTSLPYVSLRSGDHEWVVSSEALGGRLALEDAVREAWRLGRSGVFRRDLLVQARLLWCGYNIVPTFDAEPGLVMTYLRQVARQASNPARKARLWVAGLQARVDESEMGLELDIATTREQIVQQVQSSLGESGWNRSLRVGRLWREDPRYPGASLAERVQAPLIFRELRPPITQLEDARSQVEVVLQAPISLTFTGEVHGPGGNTPVTWRWTIDEARLASMLVLEPVLQSPGTSMRMELDQEAIQAYVATLAQQIDRPPREGRFDYDPRTQELRTLEPEQKGYAVDVARARDMVIAAALGSDRYVELPVNVTLPRVTRADLEAILPLALISEGESSFYGSEQGRLQNIRVAASKSHGVTVPPRTTFSFLHHLGLVTVANGYSESWVIYGDRTALGPGGGVCQVSTTCFRAAFWGGYPILERYPHSYRVGWYEPPIGLDAAVFSPQVDFRFQNDADTPILILTELDESKQRLYFRIYGKPTGRTVTIEGPITENPVPAGEPIYERDPSLASGVVIQVERAHEGIDATIHRVIEREGTVIAREKFFSRYEPWPARYRASPDARLAGIS